MNQSTSLCSVASVEDYCETKMTYSFSLKYVCLLGDFIGLAWEHKSFDN
jgi:hypothetical protein